MSDPRREEYRAQCLAAARHGVLPLKWPKAYSLFVSNLNDNVNERLLREELSSCGSVSFVKIPTLHGRSLSLAHVELQPGVKPDPFIKEFHQRELLGQKMNVVIDQGAKKFDEAMNKIKSPKKVDKTKELLQASPKKRTRVTDSPNYSPASPVRPVSDCDGPSPSKPKRPRCNSPKPASYRRNDARPSGDDHDMNRPYGARNFYCRRDSYRGYEPYSRTYPRNFTKDGPRDYRERYQENRDQYDHRSSFHYRNRFHSGGSRQHRHDNYGDYRSHHPMHRDRYNDYRRHDRRNNSGFRDLGRSPPRPHEFGYGRDHSGRYSSYNASVPSSMRRNFRRDEKPVDGEVWLDDIRQAITIRKVPQSTLKPELLLAFQDFRPRNAIPNGDGNWTMWFDEVEDRNRAAATGSFKFKDCDLQVKMSSFVVGRKSASKAIPEHVRRHERYSRDFDRQSDPKTESSVYKASGPINAKHREGRFSWRDGKYNEYRSVSRQEHRTSGQQSTYGGAASKFSSRTSTSHDAPDRSPKSTPGQQTSLGEKAGKNNGKEIHHENERNGAQEDGFPGREKGDERCRMHDASANEQTCTLRESDRGRATDAREDVRKVEGSKMISSERKPHTNDGQAESTSHDEFKKITTSLQDLDQPEQKVRPVQTLKNFTIEEFADIVARHVYRTAKEAITSRGAVVQKSFVAQSVVKFVNSRREKENDEKTRAKKTGKSGIETAGGATSSLLKTAHLDLVETFLRPAQPKKKKPPLPERQSETPSKKRVKRPRFADRTESEKDVKPGSSVYEDEEPSSPEDRRGNVTVKRRRLVLPSSPGSTDPGRTSPDGNRQNSVESLASSELFREKDPNLKPQTDENKKIEESVPPEDTIINIEKPQVRHAKASSLKLSSPSTGEGSIPHLVLSVRPPPSPGASVPIGSTFTTSEDSTSQGLPKPSGIAKKATSKKGKTSAKAKKKGSLGQVRLSKKHIESATDDEQYADVLLSLNNKLKSSRNVQARSTVEVFSDTGFIDVNQDDWGQKEKVESLSVKEPPKSVDDRKDHLDECEPPKRVDPDECEPPERVGKCARTDVFIRSEHVGQHRQRNVHARTSTSTQSSRECRQENRVYRKGVNRINPKNDIISFNHLKQRRKKVSFGQSRIHGMGLYAKESIESGEFIIEYVGDLIRRVVADLREKKYVRQGMGDSYLFRLSGDWVIDATRRGGIARYINHSCDPNLIAKIISVVGEPKIVFYSKRSIKEGEELTYDYKFDYEAEDQKIPCLCKAASCRKYLN